MKMRTRDVGGTVRSIQPARSLLPRERALLGAAASSCVLAPVTVFANAPSVLRLLALLGFFCVAPGAALVPLLRGSMEAGLVIGTSLGVVLVVAQAMLWLDLWQPRPVTYGVAVVCLPLIVMHLLRPAAAAPAG